jgi:type II secretory pathway component PulF
VIAAGMLVFVFPNITALFVAFDNAKLPAITQFFIDAGNWTATYGIYLFAIVIILIVTIVSLNKFLPQFRYKFSEFLIQFPIFGSLIQMENQILIANSLSQMLNNGVMVNRALHSIKTFTKNVVYHDMLTKTLEYVEDGKPFSKGFEECRFIDPIMARMIATGERTSEVPKLLRNLSEYYNGITDIKVEQIKAAVQPVLLIVVYVIVGVMILAVMLPMISLGSQVG